MIACRQPSGDARARDGAAASYGRGGTGQESSPNAAGRMGGNTGFTGALGAGGTHDVTDVAGSASESDNGASGNAASGTALPWAEWPMPNCPGDVEAGAPNPESYTDNGDGTVTDNVTGLMWQQAVSATTYSWADALAYCPTLTLAGHHDWRLPSRIELVSIVDDSLTDATTDSANFPATPAGYFWTSSRLAGTLTDAWTVVFNGGTYAVQTSDSSYARCVR